MVLAAFVLASCFLSVSGYGGSNGDDHGTTSTETAETKSHDVTWMIPGSHSHDGGQTAEAAHDMTVEIGEGKVLQVKVDEVVTLKWEKLWHDLHQLSGQDELSECNFTDAVELVPAAASGTFTLDTQSPTTYYLSCKVGTHCEQKQKLIVKVGEGADSDISRCTRRSAFAAWALSASLLLGVLRGSAA